MTVGNLPALFKPGPSKRGICGMRTCDARKPSYFWASFFHELLVFVQFLQVLHALEFSTATLCLLAMHSISENDTFMRGRGMCGSLMVPAKR